MEGWIKLHRKLLDNPITTKDSDYLAVWIYLLLNATHREYDTLFKGKRITLQEGQLITGRKTIAKKFKIDDSKVQRILKMLEIEHQIEQQNGNQNRLITILSWDKYQQDEQQNEQQVNNDCTTTEQQVNTNKNIKNIKNDKNNNIPVSKSKPSTTSAKANKHKYGEYQNVLLKDEELQSLKANYENWEELIQYLDEYIEMKGYMAKSHYLCIKKWVVDAVKQKQERDNKKSFQNYEQRQYSNLNGLYANKKEET